MSQVSCLRWEEALAERGVAGKCELQGIWPPTPSTFPGAGSGQGSQWRERTTEKQAELNRLGAGLLQKGKETTRASAKTLSLIFDSHGLPQRRRVGQMRKLCECRDVVRRSPTHPLPEDASQPRDPDTKHQWVFSACRRSADPSLGSAATVFFCFGLFFFCRFSSLCWPPAERNTCTVTFVHLKCHIVLCSLFSE